jgi:hypothetical protein
VPRHDRTDCGRPPRRLHAAGRHPARPRNPKRHDQDGIAASFAEFGLAELPLLDERTGLLVAGHGRVNELQARQSAGGAAPDGVRVDADGAWLVPVIRGWASRTDAQAEAYLLGSNRIGERGGWDEGGLALFLSDLAATDFDLAMIAGWDAGELEDCLAEQEVASFDAPEYDPSGDPAPLSGPGPIAPEQVTQPAASPTERVHDTVPATNAGYAETAEQEAARTEMVANYQRRVSAGSTEMILIYNTDDRAEVQRLLAAAKAVLGAESRSSDLMLRALRLLVTVLDDRNSTDPISLAQLAARVGAPE